MGLSAKDILAYKFTKNLPEEWCKIELMELIFTLQQAINNEKITWYKGRDVNIGTGEHKRIKGNYGISVDDDYLAQVDIEEGCFTIFNSQTIRLNSEEWELVGTTIREFVDHCRKKALKFPCLHCTRDCPAAGKTVDQINSNTMLNVCVDIARKTGKCQEEEE